MKYNINMTQNRDKQGRFAKYHWGKIIFILVVIFLIIGGISQMKKDTGVEEAKQVVEKPTNDELDRIMNEENFKKETLLRARKVASDSKMSQENIKHEDIINAEKTRHESVLAQIEAENEAIRAEELALVGSVNLK